MSSKSIKIFTEDAHGIVFFRRLCRRLKEEDIIDRNISIRVDAIPEAS